jgi:hypothetical protein
MDAASNSLESIILLSVPSAHFSYSPNQERTHTYAMTTATSAMLLR